MTTDCILYVEDEENDVFLLKHVFKQAEIANPLHTVRNGQEATDYLSGLGPFANRSLYPLPSLILMDLKMPQESGLDVLRWIRQRPEFSPIVVILFSSSRDGRDIKQAYQLGANCYIVKPSNVVQLLSFALALKEWWLGYNNYAPVDELAAHNA